jgi:DNA-binding XRE family transcriptional regulator
MESLPSNAPAQPWHPSAVTRKPETPGDGDTVSQSLQKVFGENLRAARTEAGLSQRALGELTGIQQRLIAAAEAGRQNLTIATMTRLATALGKQVPDMLMRTPRRSRPPSRS